MAFKKRKTPDPFLNYLVKNWFDPLLKGCHLGVWSVLDDILLPRHRVLVLVVPAEGGGEVTSPQSLHFYPTQFVQNPGGHLEMVVGRFLSDPGVPGVRSMGPDVSH